LVDVIRAAGMRTISRRWEFRRPRQRPDTAPTGLERRTWCGTWIAFPKGMSEPVHITFRNMTAHQALAEAVRSRALWLEKFDPRLTGCRVVLEFPHRHQKRGRPFSVHIQVSVPGDDVTVNHESLLPPSVAALYEADAAGGDHRDAIAAINDAFDIARRRVEDAARKRRAD
jgi:hypothetical protein